MKGADREKAEQPVVQPRMQLHPIAESDREWQEWKDHPSPVEDVKTRVLDGIPGPKKLRRKCKLCRRTITECKCLRLRRSEPLR